MNHSTSPMGNPGSEPFTFLAFNINPERHCRCASRRTCKDAIAANVRTP